MTVEMLAPVRKQVTLEAPAARAFEVFTQGMTTWWKRDYSIGAAPFVSITIEPHQGGRWFETDADGNECSWGRVLAWEPPGRVVLTWQIDSEWTYDPDLVTELEIRFVAESDTRTRVELEHRYLERYGAAAVQFHAIFDSPDGWQGLLRLFADAG